MDALLNDLSYIPPNNEHNEPTQGDIGETSNEPTQATRNEFEELYASANEELYHSYDYVTRLYFMAKFTYFKIKDLDFCPVCNTSRWKDSNTPGKKVPKKVLRYFSIIPRLQRLYKSSHTAKEMIWHATGKCTEPGKMQHPVDGGAWKKFDTKYPDFAKEPRNVRLGLAADGFNPFGNLSQAYSMWPMILTTYNLPPWLCMKESSFMLTLLIPGPKSPGKDIDVYLRPLIEDLKVLWDRKGVETIDVASGQKFNMRAMVLWTINDFPARSSLSGWSGQGYKACPTCNEDTPSVRVLSKTAYVGHRRFLKKPHKWRRSLEFNGQTDNTDPPKEFGRDVILAQLDRLPTRVKGKHPSYGGVKIKRNVHIVTSRPRPAMDQGPEVSTTASYSLLANGPSLDFNLSNSCVVDVCVVRVKWFDLATKDMSSADVARSHGGDGGGEDRPPPHHVSTGDGGGKGTRKPNLGGRGAVNTRDKTRNLSLKKVAEAKGPVSIQFDVGDKQTLNPLGPHAAHWSNYIGEVVRSVPLYYPSW
ncbi:hypothetical protein Tco_0890518 [Tanacetum coccineum]|uniref:DUF4218 domain-containing protein n=1 Tax=Tanacetum coccineum TaxID=301880 RepID=A0ABQ5C3L7_9ASTR